MLYLYQRIAAEIREKEQEHGKDPDAALQVSSEVNSLFREGVMTVLGTEDQKA